MNWINAKLSQDLNMPLYVQLADFLREKITEGELKAGEKLPGSKDLQKIFKLSSITVENGVKILVDEGILVRHQRIGTFVAKKKVVPPRKNGQFRYKVRVIISGLTPDSVFWFRILNSLERKLRQENCEFTLLSCDKDDPLSVKDAANDCSGVILVGINPSELAQKLYKLKVPLVLIGGLDSACKFARKFDMILHDDVVRGYTAMRHLLLLGHRRIGTIHDQNDNQYGLDLMEGIRKAMSEFNNPPENLTVLRVPRLSLEDGEKNACKLLCSDTGISALFMPDPPSAVGALKAALQLGFQVPQDLSIITIGLPWLCSITQPPITTITDAEDEITTAAVARLIRQIETPDCKTETLSIHTEEIIFQKSTQLFSARNYSGQAAFHPAVSRQIQTISATNHQ